MVSLVVCDCEVEGGRAGECCAVGSLIPCLSQPMALVLLMRVGAVRAHLHVEDQKRTSAVKVVYIPARQSKQYRDYRLANPHDTPPPFPYKHPQTLR